MASPTVVSTAETAVSTAGTSHAITLPSGIASTDLVLITMDIGSTSATLNALTDWTELLDEAVANGLKILWYTGAGVPSNPTFTSSASTRSATIAWRISGADKTVTPQIGTTATGTSATPNPPASATPPSSKDYLFIAFAGMAGEEADDDTWGNTPPTNYLPSPPLQKSCGTAGTNLGGLIVAASRRVTTGSAEDPGTFGVDVSAAWRAQTVTIHPAPATAYTTEVLADSPAVYFKMDETGAPLVDQVAGVTATQNAGGGITYGEPSLLTAGNPGSTSIRGTRTPGTDPNVGHTFTKTGISADLYTLECWFEVNSSGHSTNQNLISGTHQGIYLNTSNQLGLWSYDSGFTTFQEIQAGTMATGVTHHVAAVVSSATTWEIFLDGVSVAANSSRSVSNGSTAGLWAIGSYASGLDSFDGWIDEVAIYPTALSSTRIGVHATTGGISAGTAWDPGTRADSLTGADALVFGQAKTIAETPAMADSVALARLLTLVEAPTMADSATPAVGRFPATIAETPTIADVATPQSGKSASLAETPSAADALTLDQAKVLSEAPSVADTLALDQAKALAEAPSMADSASPIAGGSPVIDESLSMADAVSGVMPWMYFSDDDFFTDFWVFGDTGDIAWTANINETPSMADSVAQLYAGSRTGTDTIAVSEVATRVVFLPRTGAEGVAISDTALGGFSFGRPTSESIVISETATRSPLSFPRAGTDTLTYGESVAMRQTQQSTLPTDAYTISDVAAGVVTGSGARLATESIVISESVVRRTAVTKIGSEAITLLDVASTSGPPGPGGSHPDLPLRGVGA